MKDSFRNTKKIMLFFL